MTTYDKHQTPKAVNELDNKIEELEKKIVAQFEERMQALEKKNKELEENLQKVLNMVNRVSEQITCSQKTQESTMEKHMEIRMSQLKIIKDEMMKIEKKIENNAELTEEGNKKRAVSGQKNLTNMST